MPGQQRLGRDNRGQLRHCASSQPLRFQSQPTTLVIGETESAASELFAQDPVLLAQIIERLLLPLIHPAATEITTNRNESRTPHRSTLSRNLKGRAVICIAFSAFEFLDITPAEF